MPSFYAKSRFLYRIALIILLSAFIAGCKQDTNRWQKLSFPSVIRASAIGPPGLYRHRFGAVVDAILKH